MMLARAYRALSLQAVHPVHPVQRQPKPATCNRILVDRFRETRRAKRSKRSTKQAAAPPGAAPSPRWLRGEA